MFDFLRVAGLATLALGAAGATGDILPTVTTPPVVSATSVEPLPPVPVTQATEPTVETPVVATPVEVQPETPRAESLAALVRQHRTSETIDAEQHCLATATYYESKGEPLEGQLAVARVVLNRAESGRFAPTICGVVRQRGQFSFVRGGVIPSAADSRNWQTAVAIARIAQNDLWDAPASNALFFHARHVAPGWRMQRVATVGNHIFYR
jgi:N-acetylmuramoyl-L-alanine amidase